MGSFKHPRVYEPLDLETIDRVCEAVWARLEAEAFERDRTQDAARKNALRKWVFVVAEGHPVEFDALYAKLVRVLVSQIATVSRG